MANGVNLQNIIAGGPSLAANRQKIAQQLAQNKPSDFIGPVQVSQDTIRDFMEINDTGEGISKAMMQTTAAPAASTQRRQPVRPNASTKGLPPGTQRTPVQGGQAPQAQPSLQNIISGGGAAPVPEAANQPTGVTGPLETRGDFNQVAQGMYVGTEPGSTTRVDPETGYIVSDAEAVSNEQPGFFDRLKQGFERGGVLGAAGQAGSDIFEGTVSALESMGKGFADVGNQLIKTPEGRQVLYQLGQIVAGEEPTPFGPSQSALQSRAVGDLVAGRSPDVALSPGLSPENQQAALQAAQRQQALDTERMQLAAELTKPEQLSASQWDDALEQVAVQFYQQAKADLSGEYENVTELINALQGPEGFDPAAIQANLSPKNQQQFRAMLGNVSTLMRAGTPLDQAIQAISQGAGGDQIEGAKQAAENAPKPEGGEAVQINSREEYDALDIGDEFIDSQGRRGIKRQGGIEWQS